MQAFPFTFIFDSAGSPDNIVLPQDFPNGIRSILLRPPAGHAWTLYGIGPDGHALNMDESVTLTRSGGQCPFIAGEVIGRAELDAGSGTGQGLGL